MTFLRESQTAALPQQGVGRSGKISTPQQSKASERLASVDLLRGLVMIVMALDHTRDFFATGGFNPRDVADPALFITRWITHFCAPTFIFLAGISASLYGAQDRTAGEVSRYLLTRGLWLVLIEFTVVRLGWMFAFDLNNFVAQVIFAIGTSMIALAALVHLPRWAVATIGL
ncbi:MAG TPA: heparan-alpha-glucosaminide N-acetyltransferase domain-containing protein, partial [Xanthobacteraceae bacterium]